MAIADTIGLQAEWIKPGIGARVLNSREELLSGKLEGEEPIA